MLVAADFFPNFSTKRPNSFFWIRICTENFPKTSETMASNEAASTVPKNQEQIIAEFQHLRNEQRNLVTNITKLEVDLKEHK